MKTNMTVKPVKEVLGLLGEQMDALRPKSKPTEQGIAAARASATVVNSYLSMIRVGMECAKMQGKKPDLGFLGLPSQKTIDVQ